MINVKCILTNFNILSIIVICIILPGCSSIRQAVFIPSEIDNYCRRISVNTDDSQIVKTCIRQEISARDQLSGMTIPYDIAGHCRELSESTGGSYQVMLTCVQQELFAL